MWPEGITFAISKKGRNMKPTDTSKGKGASYVPGFWEGVASIFGMTGTSETEPVSDAEALSTDWENVGNDIRNAMNKYAAQ